MSLYKRIASIKIVHTLDEYTDTSFLGEYTNNCIRGNIIRQYDEFYERIDTGMERDTDGRFYCKKSPDISRYYRNGEHPAFKPYAGGEKIGTKNYYNYGMEDYKRMESLNSGNWYFMGISAIAEINTSNNNKEWLINKISSGGLWGIESDSSKEYIKEIELEELNNLKDVLKTLGFPDDEIESNINNAELKEDY
jgi:hypothetical protein